MYGNSSAPATCKNSNLRDLSHNCFYILIFLLHNSPKVGKVRKSERSCTNVSAKTQIEKLKAARHTPKHLHIRTSAYPFISHPLICTSAYLHICISAYLILAFAHLHIRTSAHSFCARNYATGVNASAFQLAISS